MSAASRDQVGLATAASTVRSPSPSMSIAPAASEAADARPALAGQQRFVQRCSPSPSGRTSGGWQRARAGRRERPRLGPSGRSPAPAPTTSGITSPALRTITVSPGTHVLGLHLVLVVQGGQLDGRAADEHRLEHGERRGLPGAADRHLMSCSIGGALLGRELVGDRPARRLRRGSRARSRCASDRRPSRPRRRSRRAGRGGAPASAGSRRRPRRAPSSALDLGVHREAQLAQEVERRRVGRQLRTTLDGAELIASRSTAHATR